MTDINNLLASKPQWNADVLKEKILEQNEYKNGSDGSIDVCFNCQKAGEQYSLNNITYVECEFLKGALGKVVKEDKVENPTSISLKEFCQVKMFNTCNKFGRRCRATN
jgi:hypothetical protein